MNKEKKRDIIELSRAYIGIILLAISGILGFSYVHLDFIQPINQTNATLIPELSLDDKIFIIANNVSQNHEYKINKYDCTDFSRELVKQLNTQLNISSYCIFGKLSGEYHGDNWVLHNPLHTWVGINITGEERYVEATAGYIVPRGAMDEYHVIKRGKCL